MPRADAAAASSAGEAIRLWKGLVEEHPHLVAYRRFLGQCHDLIGVSWVQRGSPATAVPYFRHAIAALDDIAGSSDEVEARPAWRSLAGACLHLGAMQRALGQAAEAEEATLQGVKLHEGIVAGRGADERSRLELAEGQYTLGRLRIELGDPFRAEQPLQRARQILEQLDRNFPCAAPYQEALARVASALAEIHTAPGRMPRTETPAGKGPRRP